ncbi:serine/threonine protein kinase [Streptomyces tateyamensis]|uniref:Serine/threonine protein kinase n=1 Tax=Streptomyces tateyamensis TaxID=565073 RepID=A0A2V4MZD6_9ACTN|nr:serine/threonine-protein kinase [Streptomyces tateyamensis]PYC70988.1 serine/threonine protein kinase [Streptomyces tateyamensis]
MRAGELLEDRYQLIGELGRGAFGVVFEAFDRRLGRQVAVKALRNRGTGEEANDLARLYREVDVLAQLTNPNIVTVYDKGELAVRGERHHYIVMELLNGPTLTQVLAAGRPELLPALDWAGQLCAALAAAHEAKVIHRDVKPENIMFARPDRQLLKVLDFGIAQIGDNLDGLTTDGVVIGSTPYLAPERWRGEPGSVRSDLYAVGCVLYELFTGARPFPADSTYNLMVQHLEEPVPHPPALPHDLAVLLRALLAKDPAERPGDAAEVRRRLAAAAAAVHDLRHRADAAFEFALQGRPEEAVERLRPLVEQFRLAFGPDDGRTLRTRHDLAVALERSGRVAQARELLAELLPATAAALGEDHPDTVAVRHRLTRLPAAVNRAGS